MSGWPKLLVYAAPETPVAPTGRPLMGPSVLMSAGGAAVLLRLPSTGAPLFGFTRKLSPLLLTTRTRSTVGLKSKPYLSN